MSTFTLLAKVKPDVPYALVKSILYSFQKTPTASGLVSIVSTKDALEMWRNVTQTRDIVMYYEGKDRRGAVLPLTSIPRAESILKAFHSDAVCMERVNALYKK